MITPKLAGAVAALALWGWCSVAVAQTAATESSGTSRPPGVAGVAGGSGQTPVACDSVNNLYALLDAAERNDAAARRELAQNCEALSDRRYEVVAQKNGVVTIRLFPRNGDRARAHLVVTLDEMVDPNVFPGTAEEPAPSS